MVTRGLLRVALAALGMAVAVVVTPVAAADPGADGAPPVPAEPLPIVVDAAAPVPADPVADPAAAITPPDGAQHLPSPQSLPPGTTREAPQHPTAGLLRDIWHALRSGEMSGTDALMLLGTRRVDPEKLAASKPSNQGGPPASEEPAPAAVPSPVPVPPPADS